MQSTAEIVCELCGRAVLRPASYVVRIEVFADPAPEPINTDSAPAQASLDQTLKQLIDEMQNLSADDLQDSVYRRFEYRICPACQKRFLANPLGMPRMTRVAQN